MLTFFACRRCTRNDCIDLYVYIDCIIRRHVANSVKTYSMQHLNRECNLTFQIYLHHVMGL